MPANYVLLERIELAASAASIVFANIPQSGYTDLKIVYSARSDSAVLYDTTLIRFNGTTSGYSERLLYGNGSSALSASNSGTAITYQWIVGASATANTFNNAEIYVPNYLSSNNKSVSIDSVSENNATGAIASLNAGLWSNSSAINQVTILPAGGNFVANSTFSLYGLAAVGTTPVIAPKATGGNLIENDGTYWIHTFTSTGTFTPLTGLTCDALVVAGGGGSGRSSSGGGGGAGGFRTGSALSVAAQAYTITVGAGGAGATTGGTKGNNGTSSIFSTITSAGGGGGGCGNAGTSIIDGIAGGSGGGGGYHLTTNPGSGGAGNTPSTSPSQGNAGGGGNSDQATYAASGGGGGASAAGATGTSTQAGAGGAGTASSISGTSVTYAGGGGAAGEGNATAGAGGAGGGGAGNNSGVGTAGTANRGGGAGGSTGYGTNGANGGSGVVIIRYPIA